MPDPLTDEDIDDVRSLIADYHAARDWDHFVSFTIHWPEDVAGSMRDLMGEVVRLKAENATLRRELDAATAALEKQGQAAFIAGMRTKAQGEASDVPHSL